MNNKYKIYLAKLNTSKKRILKVAPNISDESGIYIFHREESGIKYCYVGQAKHLLKRTAEHLLGYQHIDLSIKKHGLFDSLKNKTGYKLDYIEAPIENLNTLEQEYIKKFANLGYQLRNKTLGSQSVGKDAIDIGKSTKGYREGLEQGEHNAYKRIKEFFDKYLDFTIKEPKYTKKGEIMAIKQKKFDEFRELLENVEK